MTEMKRREKNIMNTTHISNRPYCTKYNTKIERKKKQCVILR